MLVTVKGCVHRRPRPARDSPKNQRQHDQHSSLPLLHRQPHPLLPLKIQLVEGKGDGIYLATALGTIHVVRPVDNVVPKPEIVQPWISAEHDEHQLQRLPAVGSLVADDICNGSPDDHLGLSKKLSTASPTVISS